MPVEKSSAMDAGGTAPAGEEAQSKGASDSTEEERKRQEEADMADFKRQLRAVDDAKVAARTYTVEPGDSLSAIAQSVYGNAGRWTEIFEANKDQISNPNLIHPGQVLRIP